jgi:pimeloyl-ACP methyl ester carboxylesterase
MPTIHNNGQQLTYEDTGGSRPVVVFNHSFGMDGSMFAVQIDSENSSVASLGTSELMVLALLITDLHSGIRRRMALLYSITWLP